MKEEIKVAYGNIEKEISSFAKLNELMEQTSHNEKFCYDNYLNALSKGRTAEAALHETSVIAYSLRQELNELFNNSKTMLEKVGIVFNEADEQIAYKLKGTENE